jgi:hypothetical protein
LCFGKNNRYYSEASLSINTVQKPLIVNLHTKIDGGSIQALTEITPSRAKYPRSFQFHFEANLLPRTKAKTLKPNPLTSAHRQSGKKAPSQEQSGKTNSRLWPVRQNSPSKLTVWEKSTQYKTLWGNCST